MLKIEKNISKITALVESVLAGGVFSSLFLTESDDWKIYLVLILFINSYRSVDRNC